MTNRTRKVLRQQAKEAVAWYLDELQDPLCRAARLRRGPICYDMFLPWPILASGKREVLENILLAYFRDFATKHTQLVR